MFLDPTQRFALCETAFFNGQHASGYGPDRLTVLQSEITKARVRYLAPSQEAQSCNTVSATRILRCRYLPLNL